MKKILSLLAIIMAVVCLSSCLKDEFVEDQTYGMIDLNTKKIIGFEERSQVNAFTSSNETVTVEIPIRLAAEQVAASDLVLNLSISNDEDLREEYNAEHEASIGLFPTNLYTVDSYEVTIPKGSKTGVFKLQLNPSKLDPTQIFGLGITINSINQDGYIISGNYGSTVALFSVKSIWDGVYKYSIINPAEGNIEENGKRLKTIGTDLLETNLLFNYYSGYTRYQFNSENTTIVSMSAFSGSVFPVSNLQVVTVDAENRIFEVKWTVLGRNVTERYERIGD